MIRKVLNTLIGFAILLLVAAIALPNLASQVGERVLGIVTLSKNIPLSINTDRPLTSIKVTPSSQSSSTQNQTTSITDNAEATTPGLIQDPESQSVANGDLAISAVVDATNRARINAGLAPLRVSKRLALSAKIKTDDMVSNHYFEHVSPTGQSVSDLGKKVGYDYVVMGENLALGNFATADDLLDAWMKSTGHRANILNTHYQEVGIYVERGTYQGKDVWFAVQHFGTQRTACPIIDKALKATIDQTNEGLKKRQEEITKQKALLESPDRPQGEDYKVAVTRFNALVEEYNQILIQSQKDIATYNKQVAAFNTCLATYQTR